MKTNQLRRLMCAAIASTCFTTAAWAHDNLHDANTETEAAHAPVGVMGDHLHKEGEWMLSYRYEHMNMDGMRDGTNDLTLAESRAKGFMVTPVAMRMNMHMLEAMYGITDDINLMVMASYNEKTMSHENAMGRRFETTAKGLGDTKVTGLFKLYQATREGWNLEAIGQAGLSLPTGSTGERDDTPVGNNQKLPYPMQLGSGTYDPIFGISVKAHKDDWTLGTTLSTTQRLGTNNDEYRLGDEYNANIWAAYAVDEDWNLTGRLNGYHRTNISGADTELNANMVPTADGNRQRRTVLNFGAGAEYTIPFGPLEGHRLGIEAVAPIYQNFDGPQLKEDYRLMVGWSVAF